MFRAAGYILGKGDVPLEVAVATAGQTPAEADVRSLWKRRRANTASPLLLVVTYPSTDGARASACGPTGEEPAVYSDRNPDQVERLAAAALEEPGRHAASRLITSMLPEDGEGLRNVGMFAEHHLRDRVPQRPDWADLNAKGHRLLGLRGQDLVRALGFTIDTSGSTNILRVGNRATALAVFLDEEEAPDAATARFNGVTPASWALARARGDNLPFVVLTRRDEIRVYATSENAGVGRKGGTETFVAANLALLPDEQAAYLPLLFGAEALVPHGTFGQLLADSQDYSVSIGERLRQRVYEQTVPRLAQAISHRHQQSGGNLDDATLHELYEQALLVVFRLLFVAYAEDRELLPLHRNGLYRQRSLKHMARELADMLNDHDELRFDPEATDRWDAVRALWNAVDAGNKEWGVPKYNGGLFSSNPGVKSSGGALASLSLANDEFGPALAGLLIERDENGIWGPVDFASLKVREFGTIYEGLLESELAVAQTDLATDADGTYLPARKQDEVLVRAGDAYLHNSSGSRKATGSYFTKPFAVSHLLDHALEPALDAHLKRLLTLIETGVEDRAAEAFFDFRVVDLAMGSGHFLVAALDRIEMRLSQFLADHPIAGVLDELDRLRLAAVENLGEQQPAEGIDTNSLLRRQVARRCIYGVDINDIAVELARLALWVHTFVEGLPLTSLNHGLVHGNSLTGIGTVDEALDVLEPGRKTGVDSLFDIAIQDALVEAQQALSRFAQTSEANLAEIRQARKAHAEAFTAARPVARLFDLAVAVRAGLVTLPATTSPADLLNHSAITTAAEAVDDLRPLHFPLTFAEVFNRERPGFDCIVGNPPWEKLQVEEHSFYSLHYPGLRGLSQAAARTEMARVRATRPDLVAEYGRETERMSRLVNALSRGPYPGLTAGRPDLYKAFSWRFWALAREGGSIGVVLPRKAFEASGMKEWRNAILGASRIDVTMLVNRAGWVFDDAEHRYTIGLAAITPGESDEVVMRGPYSDMMAYTNGLRKAPSPVSGDDLRSWTPNASFPLLADETALDVFLKMRKHPNLTDPQPGYEPRGMRELNASDDAEHFNFDTKHTARMWPVFKGASFDLWNPDTREVFAWADPRHIIGVLERRRANQVRNRRSPFFGMPHWAANPDTLPARHPRIAWRDSARATDNRTVRAALVPPQTVLVHQAYTFFWRQGDARDVAYLLGVIASMPFDWLARQFVESHVTIEFLTSTPVPRRDRGSALQRRIEKLAGRLAAVDSRFDPWATAVGVQAGGARDPETRTALEEELDAAVALLYGLSEQDITYIFTSFHTGANYAGRCQRVASHYRRLATDHSDV